MSTTPTESQASVPPPDAGAPTGVDALFPVVYEELRQVARRHLQREPSGHTLTTTDLVHQAYVQLADQTRAHWTSRAHFMAVAAMAMRRILVDHARRHGARKRGDGVQCVPIDDVPELAAPRDIPILALDQALDRLEKIDPELTRIVELRAFGGLTIDEAALVLKVSASTAKREWRTAKAWLNRELGVDTD